MKFKHAEYTYAVDQYKGSHMTPIQFASSEQE